MITFLIADDERIERRFLRTILEKHSNYRIIAEAENGKEAADLCKLIAPDIVILDINMPIMNGLEAAEKIRSFRPEQIIILNTAYAEFSYASAAVRMNLNAYLLKPSNEEDILITIRNVLRKQAKTICDSAKHYEDFRSDVAFPFQEENDIYDAVKAQDPGRMRKSGIAFIRFFQNIPPKDEYRLYFLNFVFNIERLLTLAGVRDQDIRLLKGNELSLEVTQVPLISSAIPMLEGFIDQTAALYSTAVEQLSYTEKAVYYIELHYRENIRLKDLASYTHISESRLSHLFRNEMKCSIPQYINRIRVEAATKMLKDSTEQIQDVSEMCGFGSVSSFYRVYKTVTGMLPAEIRRKGDFQ